MIRFARRRLFPIAAGAWYFSCATGLAQDAERASPTMRAGMIGLDTSHVVAFSRTINAPNAEGPMKSVEITAAYRNGMPDNEFSRTRIDEFTKSVREMGITIYDSIEAMLPHVDVVLIESVDGRPHLEQARKVIAAGRPMYIDKPMASSLAEVLVIFREAREAGVPVFSASSLRFSSGFQAAREGKLGKVLGCTAWSPYHVEPHHPSLFWYGIHGVETLYTIMGPGCRTVVRERDDRVVGYWTDGRTGVWEARQGYGAEIETPEGTRSAGKYEGYGPLCVEICRFFQTHEPPVAETETIEIFAFMEAADVSRDRGGRSVEITEVMASAAEKAKTIAKSRA
ncbi:MAG: gfo/Idh/MocA family oxidoreductase [Planctomycetota bacterium]|nr:MAG: gfo/Idh/MocA family oxidoreductase [Planctomycetota bacterium]